MTVSPTASPTTIVFAFRTDHSCSGYRRHPRTPGSHGQSRTQRGLRSRKDKFSETSSQSRRKATMQHTAGEEQGREHSLAGAEAVQEKDRMDDRHQSGERQHVVIPAWLPGQVGLPGMHHHCAKTAGISPTPRPETVTQLTIPAALQRTSCLPAGCVGGATPATARIAGPAAGGRLHYVPVRPVPIVVLRPGQHANQLHHVPARPPTDHQRLVEP